MRANANGGTDHGMGDEKSGDGMQPELWRRITGILSKFLGIPVRRTDSAPDVIEPQQRQNLDGDADAIGQRLKRLSAKVQVLSVTHAPQVAARASTHFLIAKGPTGDAGDKIATRVAIMEPEHRKEEIARMLAGASVTDEARAAAAKLLAAGE